MTARKLKKVQQGLRPAQKTRQVKAMPVGQIRKWLQKMLRKQGRIQVVDLLLNPLTLLYDICLGDKGIQFILFRLLVIATVPYENIAGVEAGEKIFKQWAAYRFVNRWVTPRYVISKKKAWFAKEVVVSPCNGSDFVERLKQHGVRVAAN